MKITIEKLEPSNQEQIKTIAGWYYEEWNTPIEKTLMRLESQPNDDVLLQLIASYEDRIVATAGLANKVNLVQKNPQFTNLKPWIALLYTQVQYRRQGIGKYLLEHIEKHAIRLGINKIYLYTFTAESLYTKCGWTAIDKVSYKGHETVVMEKHLV